QQPEIFRIFTAFRFVRAKILHKRRIEQFSRYIQLVKAFFSFTAAIWRKQALPKPMLREGLVI
ncbi:hypothetical protein, partial [Paenibacillus thiaminolyticus]|uniref:hypothetical protein n=1 Tax=Paenibacillus thiaminolyticus TaxID=49283 RepID=UPI001C3F736D